MNEYEYYVTFGYQYSYTEHPLNIHPDGYLTIVADDYETARNKAFELTDGKFAFIYPYVPPPKELFTSGEIMRVET